MKANNILWETDEENIDLPNEVDIPEHIKITSYNDNLAIADYLTDTYGFLVLSCNII